MMHATTILLGALAQDEAWRSEGPRPPRLASTSSPLDVFLEQPLLTAGVALFLGVVLFFFFNRSQQRKRAIGAAAGAVVAAAGLYLLGEAVRTEREQVMARTRELIRAVEESDIGGIEEMLAPTAAGVYYGREAASPRAALVRRLDDALRRYPITSARVSTIEAASRLKGAAQTRSRVVVRAPEATFYDVPTALWFLIDWRVDERGDWLATRIELEMIEGPGAWRDARP